MGVGCCDLGFPFHAKLAKGQGRKEIRDLNDVGSWVLGVGRWLSALGSWKMNTKRQTLTSGYKYLKFLPG